MPAPESPTLADQPTPTTREVSVESHIALALGVRPSQFPQRPVVPGYEIVRELGAGGMGVVYLARQPEIDRPVALKMLKAGVLADGDARVRFTEEARVVARLRHPNVVQLYEVGDAHGQPYLALEYVPGPTLAAHAASRPQPVGWAAELVEQLARAMQYAHEQGVVHRDLKPGNVLLQAARGEGQGASKNTPVVLALAPRPSPLAPVPKVADFGLAKVLGDSPVHTQSGLTAGTPGYMAPEQVRGDRAEIGPWTDVYALGVILYELLTGRVPFPNLHPTAAMLATTETPPPSPRRARPDTPRDLETVCLKCLAKSPRDRYLTAAELAADLERFRAGRPVLARRAGFVERAWKLVRRNPLAASLTVALAASLAVGFAGALVLWRQAENRSAEAVRATGKESAARKRAETAEADAKAGLAALEARQSDLTALNTFLLDDIIAAPRPKGYPKGGSGSGTTVREAVTAAADKIDARFTGKPQLAASAEYTLGESFRQMGEYAAAVKHLARAVELRERLDPPDPSGLVASRYKLAVALTSFGKGKDAVPLFRQVLTGVEVESVFGANVRRDFGLCLVRLGDTDAVAEVLTAARATQEKLRGPDHPETVTTLNALASAHTRAKRFDLAVELGREAVERVGRTEPDGVVMAYSLNTLGSGLSKTGALAEAEPALTKAVELHAKVIGAEHPDTIGMAFVLARVLVDQQKWAEAEERLRPLIPHTVEALGPAHYRTREMRTIRLVVLGRLGNVAAAEVEAVALLDALRSMPDAEPREVSGVEGILAKIRAAKAKRPVAPPPRPKVTA